MIGLFFRRLFWRIQKCERCKKILFLSKNDVEFERANLLMRMCGHRWMYGFYCRKCGGYNALVIPKNVQTDITFEADIEEVDKIIKESHYLLSDDKEEIEEDNNQ